MILILRTLALGVATAIATVGLSNLDLMPQRVYAATLDGIWSAGALVSGPLRFMQDDDDGDDDDGGTGGNDDDGPGGGGGGDDGGGTPGGDPGGDDGGGFGDDDGGAGGGDDGGGFGDDDDGGAGGDDDDGGVGAADDDGGPGGGDDDDGGSAGGGGTDPGDDDDDDRRRSGSSTFNVDAGDTFLAAEPELTRIGSDEIRVDRDFLARKGQLVAIAPSAESLRTVQSMGFSVERRITLPAMGFDAVILSIPGNSTAESALRAVRSRDPNGRYDYNHLYDFRLSTGASSRIKAEQRTVRHALSRQRGYSIGIVDTPVDLQHPGLRGAQIVQRSFLGQGRAAEALHGTAVASILMDQRDGLLPAGRLFVASIFKESVRGDAIGAAVELAQAIDWMVAERVAVINMSLAGPHNLLLEQSVLRANMRGHLIVAAVGNAGPASRPLFPAAYGNVVGITAIDEGGTIYRRALRGPQVDFSALGVNVKGALGRDYAMHSGTSFASPFAAAVVALGHKQPDPRTAQVIMQQLARDAADLGPRGRDDIFGHGLIRVGTP